VTNGNPFGAFPWSHVYSVNLLNISKVAEEFDKKILDISFPKAKDRQTTGSCMD